MRNTKKISVILFLALTFLCFSACHDPIFEIINNEVEPETYGLHGEINSIVRFKGYIYTATGYLYRKTLEPSSVTNQYNKQWKQIDIPDNSMQIKFIASDSNYLYAYTIAYVQDYDNGNRIGKVLIYYSSDPSDSSAWNVIDDEVFISFNGLEKGSKPGVDDTKDSLIPFSAKVFDNQALNEADRNAYILCLQKADDKYIHKIFKLNGNSLVAVPDNSYGNKDVTTDSYSENKKYTINAVYYKGNDYFVQNTALSADDKYIYYTESSNTVYIADGWNSASGFTFTGTEDGKAKAVKINCSDIHSLGITKDYLLLGTSDGIQHVKFSDTRIPDSSTAAFSTNARNILHSPYSIPVIFVLDSAQLETETDIYAANEYIGQFSSSTTALFIDIGLWAYYPGRGTWNKDGTSEDKHNNLPNGN